MAVLVFEAIVNTPAFAFIILFYGRISKKRLSIAAKQNKFGTKRITQNKFCTPRAK